MVIVGDAQYVQRLQTFDCVVFVDICGFGDGDGIWALRKPDRKTELPETTVPKRVWHKTMPEGKQIGAPDPKISQK
ncbi:hypothetical protein Q1695_012329 [Nippostrongylus brasiliensis]|nr:hypothetical protein Q1695_012329 [Nippostrongylus brasiliensis]